MRCWLLIQVWTFFALQSPLNFGGCRRVSTHAARDNQPEWIAAWGESCEGTNDESNPVLADAWS
jgi:hypothetical protein